jgi:hypothetical protein
MLQVTMPKGSVILKPRRAWQLFGQLGGGLETRNISKVTHAMYIIVYVGR